MPLAATLFAEYFHVAEGGESDIEMHHLGLRTMFTGLLRGKAYYPSFFWILRLTRPKTELKDRLNDVAFWVAKHVTRLSLPDRRYTFEYQGFMEMQGLKPFKSVSLEEFQARMPDVLSEISRKAHATISEITKHGRDVVFPSGTAHQIMPPEFGAEKFSNAVFAFHQRDDYANRFTSLGLEVIRFETPEDILRIMSQARRVYCTDSFPSHLAQTWFEGCYLFMSQQKARMVVACGFPGERIYHSFSPCHPCRSRARITPASLCDAEQFYCKTWQLPNYFTQVSVGEMASRIG